MSDSIYNYPKLYDMVCLPDLDVQDYIRAVIKKHVSQPKVVMDPACGTGFWLEEFAALGCHVVGNDISPVMLEYTREKLKPYEGWVDVSLTLGDMTELKAPRNPKVDFIINLDSTIGHLSNKGAILTHLKCAAKCMVPGGIYLLGCSIYSPGRVRELYTSDSAAIEGLCFVTCLHESYGYDALSRKETIKRTTKTSGWEEYPSQIEEVFELQTISKSELYSFAEKAGFTVEAVYDYESEDLKEPHKLPIEIHTAEVLAVLRKPGQGT